MALRNVLHGREMTVDENTLVVDLGAGKTEINIFRGGKLRFSRCVESGGLDMTRAIAEALNIGLQEAEDTKRALNILTPPDQDQAVAALQPRIDGLLMEILAARGNTAEALRVYTTLCNLLRDELGVTPSAATRAVHDQLVLA